MVKRYYDHLGVACASITLISLASPLHLLSMGMILKSMIDFMQKVAKRFNNNVEYLFTDDYCYVTEMLQPLQVLSRLYLQVNIKRENREL
jgi:hypothetical protein